MLSAQMTSNPFITFSHTLQKGSLISLPAIKQNTTYGRIPVI